MASTHVALITAGGTSNRRIASSLYGYCQTGASTAAKTVSLYTGNSTSTDGSWASGDLFHGLTITVRFRYSNTASNPTLNVNSTGAKRIYKYGTTSPGTTATTSWQANSVISLTYDTLLDSSGCWVMNDHLDDTTGGSGSVEYTLSGSGDDDEYTITATPTTGTATSATIPAANQTDAGVMTALDKTKLDGIATGAEANVQSDWDEADSSSDAYILNKPTIPTVNDATLTIQKNGSTIDTFTANSNTNTTVNVTVPTATSELNNDSDFVSDASYVHTDNNFTTTLKDKLDGIEAGAQVNRAYTAVTGKPTGNLTPAFGGTATISQITQDTTGQITATDRTITIPNTAATTSTAGLMSAADKTKLNHLGTLSSDDGTKSLSNTTTLTKIADCGSFDAGTYILFGCVEFPSNSTGTRAARFYCGGTGSGTAYAAQAAGSGVRALSISAVQVFSSSTAIELRARQNSGGALTVSYWWRVLRIK